MAVTMSLGMMRMMLELRIIRPPPLHGPLPATVAEVTAAADAVDVIPAADASSSPPRPPISPCSDATMMKAWTGGKEG